MTISHRRTPVLLAVIALAGCSLLDLSGADLRAGSYELTTVRGEEIPVTILGRITILGGEVRVAEDHTFTLHIDSRTCVVGDDCSQGSSTEEGSWYRADGRIEMELDEQPEGATRRFQVDGSRVRMCRQILPDRCEPVFVFEHVSGGEQSYEP